ncbi:hypothetical protein V8E54_010671 [Elaphomyces granulatus]
MLISIVILLKEYDSHPLPYWSFHLNLNSWATDWVLMRSVLGGQRTRENANGKPKGTKRRVNVNKASLPYETCSSGDTELPTDPIVSILSTFLRLATLHRLFAILPTSSPEPNKSRILSSSTSASTSLANILRCDRLPRECILSQNAGEAVPLRKKPDILPTLAAFNLRRGGSPAPILDRGILPPPHVPRGLLANIVVHEIGGRVGGGREDDIVGAAKLRKSASECRTPGSERGRLPYDLRTDIEGARNCERQLQ